MSVFEVRGGPINRRYLDRKTKHELTDMYMTLLDAFTKMEERTRAAEQEKAELKAEADQLRIVLATHASEAKQEKAELVEALKRVLMWTPQSTEAACVQDHNDARALLAKHEQENRDDS